MAQVKSNFIHLFASTFEALTRQVSDVIFPVFSRNNLLFSAFGTSFQAITRFLFPFHQISSETEVRFHRDVRPSDVFAKFCSKSRHHETH